MGSDPRAEKAGTADLTGEQLAELIKNFCDKIRIVTDDSLSLDHPMASGGPQARSLFFSLDGYMPIIVSALRNSRFDCADDAITRVIEIHTRLNAAYARTRRGDWLIRYEHLISPQIAQNEVDLARCHDCCLELEMIASKIQLGVSELGAANTKTDEEAHLADASDTEDDVFRMQNGGVWEIRFNGESAHVNDLKGFHYIALLLDSPRRPIAASELFLAVNPPPPGTIFGKERDYFGSSSADEFTEDPDSFGLPSADESADKRTLRECHARLAQLRNEIPKEGNEAAKRELEREREELLEYVSSVTNQSGRSRKTNSVTEGPRKSVGNAITRALKELRGPLPKLAAHLKSAISMGNDLEYRDDSTWLTG